MLYLLVLLLYEAIQLDDHFVNSIKSYGQFFPKHLRAINVLFAVVYLSADTVSITCRIGGRQQEDSQPNSPTTETSAAAYETNKTRTTTPSNMLGYMG